MTVSRDHIKLSSDNFPCLLTIWEGWGFVLSLVHAHITVQLNGLRSVGGGGGGGSGDISKSIQTFLTRGDAHKIPKFKVMAPRSKVTGR